MTGKHNLFYFRSSVRTDYTRGRVRSSVIKEIKHRYSCSSSIVPARAFFLAFQARCSVVSVVASSDMPKYKTSRTSRRRLRESVESLLLNTNARQLFFHCFIITNLLWTVILGMFFCCNS